MSLDKAAVLDKLGAGKESAVVVLEGLQELRVCLDTLPQTDFPSFLETFFSRLRNLLEVHEPQFASNDIHKIRHATLEIFSRMPQNLLMKDYVMELMTASVKVLNEDNDLNAYLAVKIVSDLNRTFRTQLETHVQSLVNFVSTTYQNMPKIIGGVLGGSGGMARSDTIEATGIAVTSTLVKGCDSVAIVAECPVLILLLFQLYPRIILKNIPYLIPVMIAMIKMNPQVPERSNVAMVTAYRDLFAAQVKSLSLVAHLVRACTEAMKPFDADTAASIMSLLRRCPDEAMSSRKDILASARHFVSTECRVALVPYLDEILDGKLMIGRHESLKSQAYVVLADLILHIKDSLSQPQLFAVLLLFCSNISDYKLSINTQLMSIRLVMNFAEKVAQIRADDGVSTLPAAYELNHWILRSMILKFKSFRKHTSKYSARPCITQNEGNSTLKHLDQFLFFHPASDSFVRDAKHVVKTLIWGMRSLFTQIQNMSKPSPTPASLMSSRIYSQYFRWALECCDIFSTANDSASSAPPSSSSASSSSTSTPSAESSAEMKDVLEHLVASLTSIKPDILREVLTDNIEFLCDLALRENMFLYVANSLLFNEKTTQVTMDTVLSYFVSKLPQLQFMNPAVKKSEDSADAKTETRYVSANESTIKTPADAPSFRLGQKSTILLRLFKFALSSVSNFPDNEKFLRSRLVVLVMESLRLANDSRVAINYYYLLRATFKTITSGKFEGSYKEMANLIPQLVVGLDSLLRRTPNKVMQCFILELSILLPARFASLIPFLPNLLVFVSNALRAKGELPQLALRTLEFWIENLNPAFLTSVAASVEGLLQELLQGVALHLQPFPYLYGTLALRVFGKLGGHTQSLVKMQLPQYDVHEAPKKLLQSNIILLRLEKENAMAVDDDSTGGYSLDMDKVVLGACEVLCSTSEWASTIDAEGAIFTSSVEPIDIFAVASSTGLESIANDDVNASQFVLENTSLDMQSEPKRILKETKHVKDMFFAEQKRTAFRLLARSLAIMSELPALRLRIEDYENSALVQTVLERLQDILYALLTCTIDPQLLEPSCVLLSGFCLRFSGFNADQEPASLMSGNSALLLSALAMNRAIVRAVSQGFPGIHSAGISLLRAWVASLQEILGVQHMTLQSNSVLHNLVQISLEKCHAIGWSDRVGGTKVLTELCSLLPATWTSGYEADILEAVFVCLRNASRELVCVSLKDLFDAISKLAVACSRSSAVCSKQVSLLILRGLHSPSSLVRLAAKTTVESICSSKSLSEAAIFAEVAGEIDEFFTSVALDRLLAEEQIGITYCISFLSKWNVSPLFEKNVADFLVPTLEKALQDDLPADFMFAKRQPGGDPCFIVNDLSEDCVLHLSVFPAEVPQPVILRLAILRCLTSIYSSACANGVVQNSNFHDLSIQLILRSFLVKWEEVISEALQCLRAVMDWIPEKRLPSAAEEEVLQAFHQGLSDPYKIDISVILGLKHLLQQSNVLATVDFSSLASLCLRSLQSLLGTGAAMGGFANYQDIIVGIMDVLNYFPSSVFSANVIAEICHASYQFCVASQNVASDQPYRVAFMSSVCVFFSRSSAQTRAYFLNPATLSKPSQAFDVLSALLALNTDSSKLLASCFSTTEGINLLLSDVLSAVIEPEGDTGDEAQASKRQRVLNREVDWADIPSFVDNGIFLVGLLIRSNQGDHTLRLLGAVRKIWRIVMEHLMSKNDLGISLGGNFHLRDWVVSLSKSLITLCKSDLCQSEIFLELVQILSLDKTDALDLNFIIDFFVDEVASLLKLDLLAELLWKFVALAPDQTMSMSWKSSCLRYLVLPVLHTIVSGGAEHLKPIFEDKALLVGLLGIWRACSQEVRNDREDDDDAAVLECAIALPGALGIARDPILMSSTFLRNFSTPEPSAIQWDSNMKIEFLKLAALLMGQVKSDIDHSIFSHFVVYAWGLIKYEELSSVKQWALVTLCQFVSVFDHSKPRITSALFVHLLKTFQVDAKDLFVGLMFDIIPHVVQLQATELSRLMKLTKKMLQDETASSHQHAHVLQLVMTHPTSFFPFRSLLTSQMLFSISRLGLNPNSSTEIRQLAIGIVDLFITWELLRRSKSGPTCFLEEVEPDFKLTPQMISITMSFIVRLSLSKETSVPQSRACVGLFKKMLDTFSMAGVKISHFDKMLQGVVEAVNAAVAHIKAEQVSAAQKIATKNPAAAKSHSSTKTIPEHSIAVVLELLTFSLEAPNISAQMLNPNLAGLTPFLQPIFASENTQLHEIFKCFIVKVVRSTQSQPFLEFYNSGFYRKFKEEMESQLKFTSQTLVTPQVSMILSLRLIHEVYQTHPHLIDNHGSSLVRLCQRLLVDSVQRSAKLSKNESIPGDDDGANSSSFQPTPSISIMAEYLPQSAMSAAKPTSILPADQSNELAFILQILLSGIRSGYLEQFKQAIVHLVISIIEGSLGQVVSNIVAEFCFHEMMTPSSHLTLKDQSIVFSKIFAHHDKLLESVAFSYNIRSTRLAERSTTSGFKPSTKLGNGLLLGLMSPERSVREKCHSSIFPTWGPDVYTRLTTFLAADIPCISHRYWPALLTSLFLDGFSAELFPAQIVSPLQQAQQLKTADPLFSGVYNKFSMLMQNLHSQTQITLQSDLKEFSLMHILAGDSIWKQFLQKLWSELDSVKRGELTVEVMKNLARNRSSRRCLGYSEIPGHSVQHPSKSLLCAFLALSPPPTFPSEFLGAIAADTGVCHEVFNTIERGQLDTVEESKSVNTMLKILAHLEDRDMGLALVRASCTRSETDLAISLESFGHIAKAQQMMLHLLSCENPDNDVVTKPFDLEQWQSRWIESAKELSQWDALSTYAKDVGNVELALESAVLTCEWGTVRSLRESPAFASIQERGGVKSKLYDIILSVIELRHGEADRFCMQSVQLALTQWQNNPDICKGSLFHRNLLHSFHRIIELRESATMLEQAHRNPERMPDLSPFFHNWRSRLPLSFFSDAGSFCDTTTQPFKAVGLPGVVGWEALLNWRGYIRAAVAPVDHQYRMQPRTPTLMESAWDMQKWARNAQKQASYQGVRQNVMPDRREALMRDGGLDVFTNIRQTLLEGLVSQSQDDGIKNGLRIVSNVNLERFDVDKKAELLRLKALCQARLALIAEAQNCFSLSVQSWESHAKTWLSWGQFCFNSSAIAEKSQRSSLALFSVTCILKATECDPAVLKVFLSRLIILIDSDDDQIVAKQFVDQALTTPAWIWVSFVPTLVRCLKRRSGNMVARLVAHIGKSFPQQVLNHVLALQSSALGMSQLKRSRVETLCADIFENIGNSRILLLLKSFGASLSTSLRSDKLLSAIQSLRSFFNCAAADLSRKCNEKLSPALATGLSTLGSQDLSDIVGPVMWARFLNDILGLTDSTFGHAVKFASSWATEFSECRRLLPSRRKSSLSCLSSIGNDTLYSPPFCGGTLARVEVPNQAVAVFGEQRQEAAVQIVRLLPSAGEAGEEKLIRFLGSDGREYSFVVTSAAPKEAWNTTPLRRVFDWAIQQHWESRRRDLSCNGLSDETPLFDGAVLTKKIVSGSTLQDMCNAHFGSKGNLSLTKQYVDILESALRDGSSPDAAKSRAFEQVSSQVPSGLLLDFFKERCSSASALHNLRRCVSMDLGVSAALYYILACKPPSASEMSFSAVGKCLYSSGMTPCITVQQSSPSQITDLKHHRHALPWRMTPVITSSFLPLHIYGIVSVSLGCSLDAVLQNRDLIHSVLELTMIENLEDHNHDLDLTESLFAVSLYGITFSLPPRVYSGSPPSLSSLLSLSNVSLRLCGGAREKCSKTFKLSHRLVSTRPLSRRLRFHPKRTSWRLLRLTARSRTLSGVARQEKIWERRRFFMPHTCRKCQNNVRLFYSSWL